jgi:8-oxo-dGTP diphosphatase
MNEAVSKTFGKRIRIRVCGILIRRNKILLAKHTGIGPEGVIWIPPGGGVEFGESLQQALVREFHEETGITVNVDKLITFHEFINPPLHALEFFFSVLDVDGTNPVKGADPELGKNQIIEEIKFVSFDELQIIPKSRKHKILHSITNEKSLINLKRHFKFS